VAQVVEQPHCKHKAQFKPQSHQKKKLSLSNQISYYPLNNQIIITNLHPLPQQIKSPKSMAYHIENYSVYHCHIFCYIIFLC
jgi:hypothetical protein